MQEALTLAPPPSERAKLHYGLGMIARLTLDDHAAEVQMSEALALYRGQGDMNGIAWALRILGFVNFRRRDHVGARAKLDEAPVFLGRES